MNKLLLIAFMCGVFGTAKAQHPLLYSETWRLTAIQIDGILLDIPANSEVANIFLNITDIDPLPDTISTTVCNELFGNVTVFTEPDKLVFTDLVQTLISCDLAANAAFEAIYFDFFFSNEGLELDYEIIELLGQRSSEEDIQLNILDSEGNKLVYGAGAGANVAEFSNSTLGVYPNPTQEQINWNVPNNLPATARLFAADGKLVRVQNTGNQMDLSDLPNGIYFLNISNEFGFKVHRVLKL